MSLAQVGRAERVELTLQNDIKSPKFLAKINFIARASNFGCFTFEGTKE